jgi:hypothetical protein
MVVRADARALSAKLQQQFAAAPWVTVILDRRRADRRLAEDAPPVERRLADRRTDRADARLPRSHRLSQQQSGVAMYELMDPEAATDCPTCRATVWFEMPRFSQPPLRLLLQVEHEDVAPRHSRHLVAIEAFGATGRSLLSLQTGARIAGQVR